MEQKKISKSVLKRLPGYLTYLKNMPDNGSPYISATALANALGMGEVQVRKDLAMVGIPGKPRRGYPAGELCEAISHALGWDIPTEAAIVGIGSLGRALLGYNGFEEQNLSIATAFDSNPAIIAQHVHGVKVRPMEELSAIIKRFKIKIGIITVPAIHAQECCDQLVAAGVEAIWNFAPIQLSTPKSVTVQNVDLAQSLAVLSHSINYSKS